LFPNPPRFPAATRGPAAELGFGPPRSRPSVKVFSRLFFQAPQGGHEVRFFIFAAPATNGGGEKPNVRSCFLFLGRRPLRRSSVSRKQDFLAQELSQTVYVFTGHGFHRKDSRSCKPHGYPSVQYQSSPRRAGARVAARTCNRRAAVVSPRQSTQGAARECSSIPGENRLSLPFLLPPRLLPNFSARSSTGRRPRLCAKNAWGPKNRPVRKFTDQFFPPPNDHD